MAKTRSQTGNIIIKKEEEEDCKTTLGLNSTRNTTGNKVAKRKPPTLQSRNLRVQHIKGEEDTDTKSRLKSASKHSKLSKRPLVSQEQINQVIDAIVNDKLGLCKAARKANISPITARHYYNEYKNDPKKKIPLPRHQRVRSKGFLTQEQVENLIRYIVNDKMNVPQASAKANMICHSGRYYYKKYLKDPNRAIPVPKWCRFSTQDQKNEFLGYVVNDKMSMLAASRKARIGIDTGRRYYHKYFKNQNPDIPTTSHIDTRSPLTQEQISKVISYIIDDNMTIRAAAEKVNMSRQSAGRHYRQYLKNNNMEIPVAKSKYSQHYKQEEKDQLIRLIVDEKMTPNAAGKKLDMSYCTVHRYYHQYLKENSLPPPPPKYIQDQFDEFIGYIFDEKMEIKAASEKAKIRYSTAYGYLQRYLKKHNLSINTKRFTPDQIDEFIGSIVEDEMTFKEASNKVNMSAKTGRKYYRQYLKDHNLPIPVPKRITQDQINRLIGYIVDDKMSILAASKKAKMSCASGDKFYRQYLKDKKRGAPTRRPRVVPASKDE